MVSELNVNKNFSDDSQTNASSQVAHRANNQQIMDGFNMNKFITNLTVRHSVLTDEVSILMSSYIKTSKSNIVCFA